jgi:uncharacterized membrane protein
MDRRERRGPAQRRRPSRLLAAELDDALRAQEALLSSLRLRQRQAIRIEDATIVTKDAGGRGAAAGARGTLRSVGAPGVTA